MSTAVILVSGGLDSCVAAAIAHSTHALAFLHLNYRQRTQARELVAFEQLANHFAAVERLVVDVSYMHQIGGSSLVDTEIPIPTEAQEQGVPTTYVPFRNANLLGIGVAWAETLNADAVYIGAHQEESAYPDCRAEFVEAYNRMVEVGTRPESHIEVCAPLIALDKTAIVRRGLELKAPLHLTWSCYQSEDIACGRCSSCRLRRKGFTQADAQDPIPYAL
ncbi:MAG: 7-cyano-7-deazaguanine synthase [Candidatus Latescibacterota bacterium]|jgi:7-cyano-7-deazaguanine synthase